MIDKSVFMVYNKFATQNVVLYLSHRGLIRLLPPTLTAFIALYLSHRGLILFVAIFFPPFISHFTFPIGD